MNFGLDPIGHVTPRPRIAMNERRSASPNVEASTPVDAAECERIMHLVRKAAEGTNISNGGNDDALA